MTDPAFATREALRLCAFCGGSGSILATRYGIQWCPRPYCGEACVEAMMQPPMFKRRNHQQLYGE